jgi:preprotein translocase subunit SecD
MASETALWSSIAAIAAALILASATANAQAEEPHAREHQVQEQTTRQRWCVSFHEVHPSMAAAQAQERGAPGGYRIYPSDVQGGDLLLREEPVLHGGHMADAQAAFDQYASLPIVTFRFSAAGAEKFASFTRNNVGRPFAVVIDGRVITAPVIREPILGGTGQINGNFTAASANQLAARIRSGTCAELSHLPANRLAGAMWLEGTQEDRSSASSLPATECRWQTSATNADV